MDDEDYLPSPRRVLVSQHHNGGDNNTNVDGEDGAAVSTYYTAVTGRRGDDDSVGGISSIGSESREVLQPPPAVKQDVSNRASADGNIAASPPTKNKNINADDSVHRDRALNLLFGSLKLSKTKSERSNASAGGGGGSTSRISSHSDATKKGDTTATSQQPIIHPTLSKMTSRQISQLEFRLRELRASSSRTKSGGDGQNVDGVHLTSSTTSSSKRAAPTTTQPPLLQRQTSANAPLLGSSSSDDDESPPPPDDENDDGGGMYGGRTGSLHAQQAISRSHSKSSSVAAAPCVSHSTKLRQQHQQSSSTSVRKNLVDMKPVSRTTSRNSAAPSLKATTTAATIVPAAGRTASGRSTTSNNESNTPLSAPANTVITSRLASGDVIKIPSKLFPTSTTITTTNAAKKTPSSTSLGVTSRVVSRLDSLGEKQSAALEKARLRRVDSVASSVAVAGADVRPTASTRSNASSDHHSHHHVDAAIKSLSDRMKRRDTAASDEEEEDGILSDTIVPTASNLLRALSSSSKNKHAPSTSVSKKGRHLSTRATGHGHDEDNYNNGGRSQSAVSSSSQQLRHFNHIAYASVEDYEREVTDEDDGPTDDHPHTWESSTHHHHKNNTNNTRRRRHKSNNNNNNASFELDSVTDSLILDDTASGNCLSKRSLNHARSITGYIPPREYLPPVFVEQYAEVIGIIDKYASMYHRQLLAERLGHEGDLRSERAWAEFSRSISKPHQPTLHNHHDDVSVVRHADRSASFATTDVAAGSTTTSPEQRHHYHPHHHEAGHQDNGSFHSAGAGGGLDTGSPLRHVQAIMAADAANSQAELLRIQLDEKCNELEEKQMELEELAHWYDQSEAAAHSGLTAKMNDFTHYQRKMEDKLKVVVTQGEALLAEHQELEHILIELEERAVTAEELLGSLQEEYNGFKESVAAIPADELEEPAPPASPRADVADKSVGDMSPMKPEDSPKSRLRKAKDMKKQLEVLQESLLGEGPLPSPKRLSKYEPEVLVQSLAAAQKEAAKWRAEAFGWKEHCDATEIEMVKYKTALELLAEQEQRQLQQQGSDSSRRGSSHQQQQVPSTMNTSMGSSTRSVEDEDRIRTMQMIQLAEEQVATRELLLREIEMENQKREMIKRGRRVIELPSQQQKPPLTTTASPSPTRSITYDYGNNNISNGGGVGEYSMPNTLPTHRAPSAQSVLTSTSPSLLQPNYNHLLPPPRPLDHSSTSSPQLQRHYQNNDDNDDRQQYTPSYSSRAFFDDPVKAMALMDEAEERDLQNRALHGGDAQRRQMAAPPASRQPKRVHFVSKNDSTSTSTAMDASASLSEYPPGTGQSYKSFMDAFDRRQERFDEYCKNTGISEEEYARAVQDQEADTNRRHREGIPSHMVPTYSHYVGSE